MCCANFNYYINRQGIQGRKGEKGDKGFSPTINVSTDTVDEYKLIIANEDNTFETPNLRGNINVLDNGGTYLRYDKETQQISAQDMDAATASTLGGVRLSTEENITSMSADTVVTPADVADALPVYLQGEGAVSITQDVETSKTKINVDLSSVNELTTRVSNAEAEIVGIQADVASLGTDVSALKDITTSHTTSISAINDNIANLNANKVAKTDFATTETAGIVKVDGTTIIVGENGTISSVGGGSTGAVIDDENVSTTTVYSSDKTVNVATNLVNNAVTNLDQTKQDTLVSGTNIKTINGQSVLGEGDITVGGSTPTNMVTTDTQQTISGYKTFSTITNFTYANKGNPCVRLGSNGGDGLGWYGGTHPAKHFRFQGSSSSADTLSLIGWKSLVKLSNERVIIGAGEGSPTPSYLSVAPDSVTFKKNDGTTVDLLNQSGGSAIIDDTTASTTTTYSSSKIEELIGNISTVLDSINGEVI